MRGAVIATLRPSDYVHLHNHTQFSLLDGLTQLGPLLDFAKEQGMEAIAKTDHGTLSGSVEFYKEAKAKGIKPIIGIETYVAMRKHTDKDPAKDKQRYHLVLLAMNNTGYKNIMRLSTIANLEGFYYHPRIDHDLLEKYNEGVIALSACMSGEVANALKNGQRKQAKEVALWYKKTFGDRYYLEIQDHGHPDNPLTNKEQEDINTKILDLAKELDIPVVVTCDAHYLKHEDQDAHEVLLCVGTGSYVSEEKRMSLKDFPLHVEKPSEIIQRWGKDYPEVITNTKAVAERCDIEIELGNILIPQFPVPKKYTEKSYLHELVYKGLAERYAPKKPSHKEAKNQLPKEVISRAEYELDVIDSMGFNGYFLIIWDFVAWGKKQGIMFGPGRGSAAGSIIAYALHITDLDPIKNDLLFERFLNPDRISMPDIDIDIQDNRRGEVIEYCVAKYGDDRVANIVTYGRMAARAAVRDVARVLQVPYADADRMAKLVPPPQQGRHLPLATSIKENNDLKKEYTSNPQAKEVYDMAVRLEGTIRSHGVHAAGVVIAPNDIVSYVPLEMAQKGVVSTQYPMGIIEELGLLKMDFLGLSNLTTIKNALRIIRKVYGVTIDINTLPLDDKKTYELLGKGDTTGVFQLESAGMKRYLKELKPTEFNDIIAMCALYRPGPLKAGLVDMFVRRKNGKEAVSVPHKKFENALSSTYGTLVYQEQVMQISKEVCGFSGGEADTLRKAIGKKIREVMLKMQQKFIDGGVEHSGVPKDVMEKFWDDLMGFADYAFNKSHSACYALIAYWTAYLKAHYPAAFMAALMTSDYDDIDRLAIEITECKHMGITVLPPDVNESFHEFSVVPHKQDEAPSIRFGMDAIKNVGHNAVENIIVARETHGQFNELADFLEHTNARQINKKVLESLIKSGALDRFGDRSALLESIDSIVAVSSKLSKEALDGQVDLFGAGEIAKVKPEVEIVSTGLYQTHEYLQWERELLGLYLSSHPLESYDVILTEKAVPLATIRIDDDGKTATIGGSISDLRQITTKNGQAMAFVQVEDIVGDQIEVVVFPRVLEANSASIVKDKVVLVKGRVNSKDKAGNAMAEPKLIADTFMLLSLDEAKAYQPTGVKTSLGKPKKTQSRPPIDTPLPKTKRLYIRLQTHHTDDVLRDIKVILEQHLGNTETVLVVGDKKRPIRLSQKIKYSEGFHEALANVVGDDAVKLH
ncbi:DNA polymerase III subunit alpha [Candidatus Nomurabacteria bacterium]|nr:DNA polymerase III subunit alpha [Candidatus Nomurabacteria bacterium]